MTTLTLYGELDAASAPDLEAAMAVALDHARSRVVVDIAPLQFIGAAGFHMLERGQQLAERRQVEFLVLADPWKLRIAKIVEERGLNIQLAPGSSGSEMRAQAHQLLLAPAA